MSKIEQHIREFYVTNFREAWCKTRELTLKDGFNTRIKTMEDALWKATLYIQFLEGNQK